MRSQLESRLGWSRIACDPEILGAALYGWYKGAVNSPEATIKSIVAATAVRPLALEPLSAHVRELCAHASPRCHGALIKAFKLIEAARDERLNANADDEVDALSASLLELNRATHSLPFRTEYDRFRSLYHCWVAVHHSPRLGDEANLPGVLEEACELGVALCEPDRLSAICRQRYEPKTFYRRLARIHLAIAALSGDEATEHENAAAHLAFKADELEAQAGNGSEGPLVTAMRDAAELEVALKSVPPNLSRISRIAEHLITALRVAPGNEKVSVRPLLAIAIKRLKKTRNGLGNEEAQFALSRTMGRLALALCWPVFGDSVPMQAPNDRYEVYDALRWLRDLPVDDPFAGELEKAVIEGIELGRRYRDSESGRAWFEHNAKYRAYFYSRHAELCRAAAIYDLVEGAELRSVLAQGIDGFRSALDALSPSPPEHVDFCSPRLSHCLRLAGRFAESEANLRPIADSVVGLRPVTVWEARRNLAIGLVQRARALGEDESVIAAELLTEASIWCMRAAQIWEPDADIRSRYSQREENFLLHSLLAWINLESGHFEGCIQHAEWFIALYSSGGVPPWRARIIGRTQFVRCQALLALGRASDAAVELNELLRMTVAPRLRVRPLVLLATVLAGADPHNQLRDVRGMLREACSAAGPKFGCVAMLTPLQLEALTDRARLGAYIRRCRELLRNRQHKSVRDEVPTLSAAIRLFFDADDPALLTLMALADVQTGEDASALRTLEYVTTLDSSAKTQRIAGIEIGKIYLRRGNSVAALNAFTQSYVRGGRRLASMVFRCRLLRSWGNTETAARWLAFVRIGANETHRAFAEREWRSILLSSNGITVTALLLRETENVDFVEMLARALTVRHEVPAAVLEACLSRAVGANLPRELRRAFVKVANRALARAYFEGNAAGSMFGPLAYAVFDRFLTQPPMIRRELIFQLFVTGRDAPLAGSLARYAMAALRRIEPVLQPTATVDSGLTINALRDLNDFLRDRLPSDFRPVAYDSRDTFEVNFRLRRLCTALRGLLSRERGNANECEMKISDRLQHSTGVALLAVEDAVRALADMYEGPLAFAAAELVPWTLSITLEDGAVSISFRGNPPDPAVGMDDVTSAVFDQLRQWANDLLGISVPVISARERFTSERLLSVSIPLPSVRKQPALAMALLTFTDFLHSETERVLNTGMTTSEFFPKADGLFPPYSSSCFDESAVEWVETLHQLYDQQFAHIAAWLCSLPPKAQAERHPRRTLHNLLKKSLQLCLGALEQDKAKAAFALAELRETASGAADGLIGEARAEVFDTESFVTHAGRVAEELAKEFQAAFPSVRFIVEHNGEPWVGLHESALRNLLRNLFHNASTAVRALPLAAGEVTVCISGSSSEDELEPIGIVIANPRRIELEEDADSSGIGIKAARQSVERWGGTFTREMRNDMWITRVQLPTVSF